MNQGQLAALEVLKSDAASGVEIVDPSESVAGVLDLLLWLKGVKSREAGLEVRLINHAWKAMIATSAASGRRGDQRQLDERAFTAEIATLLTISERAAQKLIGTSVALNDLLPTSLAALYAGTITLRHAEIVLENIAGLEDDCVAALEALVLPVAAAQTPPRFAATVRKARERLHPETIDERHDKAMLERTVVLEEDRDGMVWISNKTDAATATAIYDKLTTAALAQKKAGDQRSLACLRSDILSALLLVKLSPVVGTIAAIPEIDGIENLSQFVGTEEFVRWFAGISARVVLTVPALSLLGESDEPATLEGYGPVGINLAKLLTARAPSLTRVLTHPETGAILSVGRKRYKIPKDLRMFLQIRDGTCRFPGSNRQTIGCDVDHTREWQDLGTTAHHNLAHLCRRHHTLKGADRFTVVQSADGCGKLTWTSPSGRVYETWPENAMALH